MLYSAGFPFFQSDADLVNEKDDAPASPVSPAGKTIMSTMLCIAWALVNESESYWTHL